ncbi:MAG: hypothetical protein GQ578_06675 [Desulfuromonadaceae bacterium]|nr:hypothetical protein [Desulfuromonadaceae bacterium]
MNKRMICFWSLLLVFALAGTLYAEPDYYYGDANVYTGSSANVPPNIMLLFDVSQNMTETGSAISYEPDADYIGDYESLTDPDGNPYESDYIPNRVYVQNTTGTANDAKMTVIDGNDGYYVSCDSARDALLQNGIWMGSLAKGECDDKSATTYYTGDMACLMFELSQVAQSAWSSGQTYSVGDVVEGSVDDSDSLYKFVCVQAGEPGGSEPGWILGEVQIMDGDYVIWEPAKSALAVAASVLKLIAKELGDTVRLGVSILNENNQGADILQPLVLPVGEDLVTFNGKMDDLASLNISGNHWQVNEALWDIGAYYNGDLSEAISSKEKGATYDPAAEYWCQSNNIILVTSGLDSDVSQTKGLVEDLITANLDGTSVDEQGTSLDVAKHLYDNLDPSYLDTEEHSFHVKTHVVQVLSGFLEQLSETAHHGKGQYYSLESAEKLQAVLTALITGLLEADSSFVAPVVPASPENRAYSGQRIYLGFFKPMNDEPWYGNLKKFGLNSASQITAFDSSGDLVKATDDDGYFLVDLYGDPTLSSFWNTTLDGGAVNAGGVGEKLLTRTSARAIYTWLGGTKDLNDPVNVFSIANSAINVTALGLSDGMSPDAANLINFIHGLDAYAQFSTDTTAKRPWILGDIMHSKPVVLNYSSFNPEADDDGDDVLNEDDPTTPVVNDSYIFVGGNDGMLHAFRDVSGEEAWAFIPPDLLKNLQYLSDTDRHYYFVDSSPVIYVYDADGDGNVEAGDKAILICGMRRGGGTNNITQPVDGDAPPPSRGSYFALDITNPEDPQFMWQINSEVDDFGEMGQTWSLPRLTKMKVGGVIKVVAVFGAGYDTNEDLRYGPNQNFPDDTDETTNTSMAPPGEGDVISAGTATHAPSDSDSDAFFPRGRGIYVVEVATLSDGVPGFGSSGQLIWSYTNADNSAMSYCIPSDPLVLDRDNDGYTDHIYIGDTGGQLWRFNVADTATTDNWTGTRIFTANVDGSTDVGRKIFYKPTATVSGDDTLLYFGTGDREHPLNTAVVDRFYVVRDRESEDPTPWPLTETNLVDVTLDNLQSSTISAETAATLRAKLTPPYYTDGTTVYYGWYIKLDENDGEKVLSNPKVFSGTVYFSTYEPASIDSSDDPCEGKLGPARLYAVNALTAEAVFNFDLENDGIATDESDGVVLKRTDRTISVGDGIASEPLVLVNNKGVVSIMVGRGGGFFNSGGIEAIDPVFPVYWMKW